MTARDLPAAANAGGNEEQAAEQLARRLRETLARRRWWFVVVTAVVFAAVIVFVRHQRPIFRATGTLQIDSQPPKVLGEVNEVYSLGAQGVLGGVRQYYRAQQAILQSRDLAAMVVSRMGLARDDRFFGFPYADKPLTKAQKEAAMANADAVGMMSARIIVEMADDSLISRISIEDPDPEFARDLANAVMAAYKDRNINNKRRVVQDAYADLRVMRKKLEETKNQSQQGLFDFERQHDFSDNRRLAVNDRILELNHALRDVHAARVKAEVDVAQLKKSRGVKDFFSASAPTLMRDTLVSELKRRWLDLGTRRRELATTYLEKHPRIEALDQQMIQLEGLASRHINATYEAALQTQAGAAAEEADIVAQLQLANAEDEEIRLNKLAHDKLLAKSEEDKMFYEKVAKRYAETDLTKDVGVNNVSILDAAVTPLGPVRPNMQLSLAIGLLLALLFGVAAALAAESLDNTVQSRTDVEEILGLPYLGSIPTFDVQETSEGKQVPDGLMDLYVYYRPNSRVAEAARSVRTNLLFMRPDKPLHTILVTSAHPREGKTSTSSTLAVTLAAASGRCVLVDTDLRKPRLHKVFGIPNVGGVTGYILSRDPLINFVHPTVVPGLDFVPCGALPPNPSEILHTDRFKMMVDELKQHYTTVIFDSPPIEIVADALVVAALVDGVVVVAHSAKSRLDWISSALGQLRSVKAPLLGIVLSRTDTRGAGYGYYYGKGYRRGTAYRARYQYRYRYGAEEENDQLEAAHFAMPGGARIDRGEANSGIIDVTPVDPSPPVAAGEPTPTAPPNSDGPSAT